MHRLRTAAAALALATMAFSAHAPAFAASQTNPSMEQQIIALINQDRVAAGLPALTIDPRLTAVADARAQYMIRRDFFSHCTGGEADTSCSQSGYDFVPREQAAGINLQAGGTTADENLAINNYAAGSAAGLTNQAWLNSPEHRANIMDARVAYTGVGVVCCFAGSIGGQQVTAADNVWVYVQEFTGGPGATPPAAGAPVAAGNGGCQFVLGFAAIDSEIPGQVGQCADNESHNPVNGDALQHTTTGGLLVWRKADNWTAFTDGFHSWVNGPYGLRERLNTQRFSWEANPTGLAVVP